MGMKLAYNESTLAKNLDKLAVKIGPAVLWYAGTKAGIIQEEMKERRPWTDQSNEAKATLSAKATMPNAETVRITLAHGVDHGKWLELAHEKKYAIIGPTIKRVAPEIVEDLDGIMGNIK